MMQESRQRAKRKKEEIKKLLANSRSKTLLLDNEPDLESIPNLVQDLNSFIELNSPLLETYPYICKSQYQMEEYRKHILSTLKWNSVLFTDIGPLVENRRQDKVWRFITLIFMQNQREINLSQQDDAILIQRVYDETYAKG